MAPDTLNPTRPAGTDAEQETARLDPAIAPRHDALSLLHHRARHRAVAPARAPAGHYILLAGPGESAGLVPIDRGVVHLGRASTSDLRFEDPHVSRRHAILVRYGRHVRVLDDRSSEGTFVNGSRVVATDLRDGDIVRIGPIVFTYVVVR
jgi:hypothetical protein